MKWLRRWLHREELERHLRDELTFHVDAHTRDVVNQGVAPQEARRRALAAFGGTAPIQELTRDAGGGRWLEDFLGDVRYAARTFRHQTGFAVVAILTLTLSIGANTAIFSMVNAVLLRPLAVPQPERLVLFSESMAQGTLGSNPFPEGKWDLFSSETYEFLRSQQTPFVSIAAYEPGHFDTEVEIPGQTTPIGATINFVSGNYFTTMGAAPALGRALTPEDDRADAPPVAVASDRFWREHLNADRAVVGRTINVDSIGRKVAYTIAGVMPTSFFGVRVEAAPDLWLPLHTPARERMAARRDLYWLSLIGRLDHEQTMAAAQTAVNTMLQAFLTGQAAAPLDARTGERIRSVHVTMAPGARGLSPTRVGNTRLLVLLLSAVGVILLIACANVGTLFLARAAAREREVAVRRALGAGRGRLIRQWLTESVLLGGVGAVCGAVLAHFVAPRLLGILVPAHIPVAATIDGVVLTFTLGITFGACLLFGLAPALSAGQVDPVRSLRLSGRGERRRRTFGIAEPFVVVQVALSLVLVVSATLLVRTLINLERAPLGFDQERVLLVRINPRAGGYGATNVGAFYRRVHDRVVSLPGVESVSFARFAPFSGSRSSSSVTVTGHQPAPGESMSVEYNLVGPHYPQTLGIPLLGGRAIGFDDTTMPVAMVNEEFIARFSGASGPIGRRFTLSAFRDKSYEIVGVMRDAHFRNAREAVSPAVFVPMLQDSTGRILDCELEIRTSGKTGASAEAVRQAIASLDSRVTVERIRTLRDQVLSQFSAERTAAGFIGTFAMIALIVAAIGLYGIVSHGLARRTNEIGIRMALGAARVDVVKLIARETFLRLGLGLLIGLAVTSWTSRFLRAQLFDVTPGDPASLTVAAALLSAVVAVTTVRPLVRAMRTDPVVALRAE